MKKICMAGLVLLCVACTPKHNLLTEQEKQEGWELLFDGLTLDQWRDYNGTELTVPWYVEDGTIAAKGAGDDMSGYIVSKKEYENFELQWDWKIAKEGNSGVLYHVVERPEFNVPYVTGPEYQLIDDEGFPEKLEEWQKTGADYAMYVPETKKLNPTGEWNTSKIVFDNGHAEYWLNGEKIIEFEAWSDDWFRRREEGKWSDSPEYGLAHKGLICLQDHGSQAWFRNIKIKELPRKPGNKEIFNGKDLSNWVIYGDEKWYIEDGMLICESGEKKEYGYLGTREYYTDFDLSIDFKQESNGNSGVFFRSIIPEGVKISGWQVEVAPLGHGTGGIYESYGRGWIAKITDEQQNILKPDEWNTIRIKVVGDEVTTWLNDVQMVQLKDELIGKTQGRIALQIHDGGGIKVLWKNFRLQTL